MPPRAAQRLRGGNVGGGYNRSCGGGGFGFLHHLIFGFGGGGLLGFLVGVDIVGVLANAVRGSGPARMKSALEAAEARWSRCIRWPAGRI